MATQLPDVHCWVKVINGIGRVIDDGGVVTGDVVIRYSVANDSHKVAGPLYVVGSLQRDGVAVKPGGKPVVPSEQITLQPNTVWKKEWTVKENDWGNYVASILGDVGNFTQEEDEKNNKDSTKFVLTFDAD